MYYIFVAMVSASILLFTACSGDNDGSSNDPGTDPEVPDFSVLSPIIEEFEVQDMAVMIGDSNGVLYTYEKGDFTIDSQVYIASANKWLTGATIWRLIEQGVISRDDTIGTYVDFWSNDSADPRSGITIENLLGQTSGFNNSPIRVECIGKPTFELYECVQTLYDGGLDSNPGDEFWYGPEHFQMGALMASAAMGYQDFREIMREQLFDPVGMSSATGYTEENNNNARYSGSIQSTANDYSKFLTVLLNGSLITDMDAYLEDRTANSIFGFRPGGIDDNNVDWHYAFGYWLECDSVPYTQSCNNQPTISSPGAFGFTPWIDFKNGYWGVIAFEGSDDNDFRPSRQSVALEQLLQEEIEVILSE